MTRSEESGSPRRKWRTRGHVIEDLSANHLERKVLLKGHVLRRPAHDYGVDAMMLHFGDDGELENGEVRFQLKATDHLNLVKQGSMISLPLKTGDLHYWALEIYPFILVVFDAKTDRAYWLDVKQYVKARPDSVNRDRATVNVHIPVTNRLTVRSIEAFRKQSLQTADDLLSRGGFPHAGRKPK